MKRKRKVTGRLLFNWKRIKEYDDDNDNQTINSSKVTNLNVVLKKAVHFTDSITLPYELLIKIFKYLIQYSDDPLEDLCCLAQVCECWRNIVLKCPALWTRIDLTSRHATNANLKVLSKILAQNSSILDNIHEISFQNIIEFKDDTVETLLKAPNLKSLSFKDMNKFKTNRLTSVLSKSIKQSKLQSLSIYNSKVMLGNQKWLSDYLMENGQQLNNLNLAMSLTSISAQLLRSVGQDYCPKLEVLDFSTCDTINTHSFDAIQLTQNLPNLRILRVANVSFKRVYSRPEGMGLCKLEELSMPVAIRDPDRDDALFSTLAYSSDRITTLDLRGSSVAATCLMGLPSYNLKELHMDDICPIQRQFYHRVILKWRSSLEILSLVKINCSETIKKCLEVLSSKDCDALMREIDLSSSNVAVVDLKNFLKEPGVRKSLKTINLTACRSLPRGCNKDIYYMKPTDSIKLDLSKLVTTLEKIKS